MAWNSPLAKTANTEAVNPQIVKRTTYLQVPGVQHRKIMGDIEEGKIEEEPAPLTQVPQRKMRLRVAKEDARYLDVEVRGEDTALLDALSEVLRRSEDVEYAGYRVDHPLKDIAHLTLKTKDKSAKPAEVLRRSLAALGLLAGELQAVGDELERGSV